MKIKTDENTNKLLLDLKGCGVYLEGNVLKVVESDDPKVKKYLDTCLNKDRSSRSKRLEVTKQVQKQYVELEKVNKKNEELLEELQSVLCETEKSRDKAIEDLDYLQKKNQFELINIIVRVALMIIIGVGITTTGLYLVAILTGKETDVIGSTWSNMFGMLLTSSFSIVGTIMGVKYASKNND